METNMIEVWHVSKYFRVFYDKGSTLKEKALFRERNRWEQNLVLDDISFQVRQGESVGLVGQNGCGKSTMLKLINRILYPDGGKITANGKISSLIELGAGFHPDLSGRENIYTNAAIFGLKKREIAQRVEQIIAFSELGSSIDQPIRTYSSGMYMRLAFSVAINVDADILLIDEILAVGDAAFQAKCFDRLKAFKKEGRTIVIVSHSLSQIEQLCDRSIWFQDGKIRMEGTPMEVHPAYLAFMGEKKQSVHPDADQDGTKMTAPQDGSAKRWGNGQIVFSKVEMTDRYGNAKKRFRTGDAFLIRAHYKMRGEVERPVFGIGIWDQEGRRCYGTNTQMDHCAMRFPRQGVVEFASPDLSLLPGEYQLEAAVVGEDGLPFDFWHEALFFQVYSQIQDLGVMRMVHQWTVKEEKDG